MIPPVPIREPLIVEVRGVPTLSRKWQEFFRELANRDPLVDTHAKRVELLGGKPRHYNASNYAPGTLYVESDRGVVYMAAADTGANVWRYAFGRMRAVLADLPADLGADDDGFEFHSTNYLRTWTWGGAAWSYADGERLPREIAWYPGTVPAGWAVCDGSAVNVTTEAAAVALYTTPDLLGKYLKGGSYTGSPGAAVPPGFTGGTVGPGGGHTHPASTAGPTVTVGVTAGAVQVGAQTHGHVITVTAAPDHTHSLSGLTADTAAEPEHYELLPIVKL